MISHRHTQANNPQMGESYDETEEHSYIMYWDANNLYGWAMSQPLPIADFEWSKERDVQKLIELYGDPPANGISKGCFVKCDLHYLPELQPIQVISSCTC